MTDPAALPAWLTASAPAAPETPPAPEGSETLADGAALLTGNDAQIAAARGLSFLQLAEHAAQWIGATKAEARGHHAVLALLRGAPLTDAAMVMRIELPEHVDAAAGLAALAESLTAAVASGEVARAAAAQSAEPVLAALALIIGSRHMDVRVSEDPEAESGALLIVRHADGSSGSLVLGERGGLTPISTTARMLMPAESGGEPNFTSEDGVWNPLADLGALAARLTA